MRHSAIVAAANLLRAPGPGFRPGRALVAPCRLGPIGAKTLQKAKREGRIGGRPRLIVNRAKVIKLATEGMSMREIQEEMGISASSVCRLLKEHSVPRVAKVKRASKVLATRA